MDTYLTIRADSSSFEEIRALVKAERECCQWMTLELHAGSPSTLTIAAASAEGKIAIKNMLAISEPI